MNIQKSKKVHFLAFLLIFSVILSLFSGCRAKVNNQKDSSDVVSVSDDTSSSSGSSSNATVSKTDSSTSESSQSSNTTSSSSSSNNGGVSQPSSSAVVAKDYYVSPNGSDDNPGTREEPLQTISCALATVNKYKATVNDNMNIVLMDGNYFLDTTLTIDQTYNLPNDKTLTIKADTGATPVINGGKQITNWSLVTVNGITMYRADVEGLKYGRSFYVNSQPMTLAASASDLSSTSTEKYDWGWASDNIYKAITVPQQDLSTIKNVQQMEVVWHCEWKTFIKRADSISNNSIVMRQPDFDWAMTPQTVGKNDTTNSAYWNWYPDPRNSNQKIYLQNDVSLIDTPGEFCYDESEKAMYFYPVDGQDPNDAQCIVSYLDLMINIKGDSAKRVQNIVFDGVTIGYGGFDLIGDHGMATEQNQHYISDVTTSEVSSERNEVVDIPDDYYTGNVLINDAKNISFINCNYINSDKAIHFDLGVEGGLVQGCLFKNLGDSAVVIGNGKAGYKMGKERTTGIVIDNNVIRKIGLVNQSVPAISAFFSNATTITHNDIYDIPYTGISVGWGWYVVLNSEYSQKNVIEYNKVGHFMTAVRDGGGIYTLGQQPDSYCRYNYIYDQLGAYGGLYHDEGSAGYITTDNVVDNYNALNPSQVWLDLNGFAVKLGSTRMTVYGLTITNNYYNNPNIVNNGDTQTIKGLAENIYVSGSDWPDAALAIINNAGVTDEYSYLLNQ